MAPLIASGLFIFLLLIISTIATDYNVETQPDLFLHIDSSSSLIDYDMTNNNIVLGSGTYQAESRHDDFNIYELDHGYGFTSDAQAIVCEVVNPDYCVFDGLDKYRIVVIKTSSVAIFTGIKFTRGNAMGVTSKRTDIGEEGRNGGAIFVSGTVTLNVCKLINNRAENKGGAIYINAYQKYGLLYGLEFDGNECDSSDCGNDAYAEDGFLVFGTTCTPIGTKYLATPSAGIPISIAKASSAPPFTPATPTSLYCSGTCEAGKYVDPKYGNTCLGNPFGSYSFMPGTAYTICPAGKYSTETNSNTSEDCLVCPKGRYSNGLKRLDSCLVCGASSYNDDDGTDFGLHSSCTKCPAGRALTDEGTDASLHDHVEDCNLICDAGRFSIDIDGIPPGCLDCPMGKYLYDTSLQSFHDEIDDCQVCGDNSVASATGSPLCATCPEAAAGITDDRSSCIFDATPSSSGISTLSTLSGSDTLRLAGGTYTNTNVGVAAVFEITIPISIICANDDKSCVLSGSDSKDVVKYSSSDGKLVLRSLKITEGRSFGIHVFGVGTVIIINCLITDNYNTAGGLFGTTNGGSGIRLTTSDSSLDLYGVTFSGNQYSDPHFPEDGSGDISNIGNAAIEVHSHCPAEGFAASAERGSQLEGKITSQIANAYSYACTMCPAGSYRPNKYKYGDCVACELGTTNAGISAITQVDCPIMCEPGQYGTQVDSTGTSTCASCEDDTYTSEWRAAGCEHCPAGSLPSSDHTYCYDPGDILTCSAGEGADVLGESCIPCPKGRYNAESSNMPCRECPAGKTTSNVGSSSIKNCEFCLPGSYRSSSDPTSDCIHCEEGKFSNGGVQECENCGYGKYSAEKGMASCTSCQAGRFHRSTGSKSPFDCFYCNQGENSNADNDRCEKCVAGKYNPTPGGGCVDCVAGTYSVEIGGISSSVCQPCAAGKSSNDVTGSASESGCQDCEPGKSAPSTGYTSCASCVAGTASSGYGSVECEQCEQGKFTNSEMQTSCEPCGEGSYNDQAGSVSCVFCVGGKYLSESSVCTECEEGKFSNPGATSCTDCNTTSGYVSVDISAGDGQIRNKCSYCGPGFYADNTDHECKPCDPGTYSIGGSDSCLPCPQGMYAPDPQSSTCIYCLAGMVVSANECLNCLPGKHAPFGSVACLPCTGDGKFSDSDGSSFCKTAKAGYKPTADHTGEEQCPEGTFSTGGTDECSTCGDGETSGKGAVGCSRCATCAAGRYVISACSSTTETECGDCLAGKASMGGDATECTPCTNPGEYSDTDRANACKLAPAGTKPSADRTTIELCPKNYFSIGASDTCTACPDGGHSKPGSFACEKCSTGKYYNETANECGICPKNTFTLSGATSIDGCTPCQNAGEYADPGSGYCERCPQYEEFDELTGGCVCMTSFERIGGTCTCKAGETLMGTSCLPCEVGKWKSESGVTSCSRCEMILKGAITKEVGSMDESSCHCDVAMYDNEKGECVPIVEGMNPHMSNMKLESVWLDPGFWRTNGGSSDVRECITEKACKGGNATNATDICREGHEGPYCDVCRSGWTKTAFSICEQCRGEVLKDSLFKLFGFVGVVMLLFVLQWALKKQLTDQKTRDSMWAKLKNGAKVLFASGQITASLPSVVPRIPLPSRFETIVEGMQILKLNFFTFLPFGCLMGGKFDFYKQILALTVPVIATCGALTVFGFTRKKKNYLNIALAISYLTLPTITTMVFGMFPCDSFDDGGKKLRSDLSISCLADGREIWLDYSYVMIALFPVGVPLTYFILLFRRRERIMRSVEERAEDEEIRGVVFLWDPYKPKFWYWEVVETTRRLGMTGGLSVIQPGTFTQLTAGLIMATIYTMLLCYFQPFVVKNDNKIAIFSSALITLTFISSYVMKSQSLVEDGYGYEATGLGILLVTATVVIALLFLAWGYQTMYDMGGSTNNMALGVVGSSVGSSRTFKSFRSIRFGKKSSKRSGKESNPTEVEMKDVYAREGSPNERDRGSSSFENSNPMFGQGGEGLRAKITVQEIQEKRGEEWFEAEDGEGNVYYYNDNGETAWEKPC